MDDQGRFESWRLLADGQKGGKGNKLVDTCISKGYISPMIRSVKDKRIPAIRAGDFVKGFPADLIARAQRRLAQLDAAPDLNDLRIPPSNRLEQLRGDRAGSWSIRVNDQWRICFTWQNGDAFEVEIVDYH
jgi:toxin HigB-1